MAYSYYCTICNFRTAIIDNLHKSSNGGCTSCGKSGYKCPKCGMMLKSRKIHVPAVSSQKIVDEKISTSIRSSRKINIKRA